MTRDLNLSKYAAQLLASHLKNKHLLHSDNTFSWYRLREKEFHNVCTKEKSLIYCHDVNGLFPLEGIKYISKDWRLIIDSSNKSLKIYINIFPHVSDVKLMAGMIRR